MGHEWIGVVEEFGADVTRLRAGDFVLAPFAFADGTCRPCRDGWFTSCPDGGFWGGRHDGGQAEAVRVPFADSSLVPARAEADADLLRCLVLVLPCAARSRVRAGELRLQAARRCLGAPESCAWRSVTVRTVGLVGLCGR
jgi:threonine dehydrogenase-like Zn-dependent dehydrogenase